jgi:3-dehydroquinate dehydratase type I
MNPRPRMIVTLPARTVATARAERLQAARAGADVVELRLDRWTEEQLGRLGQLFPSALPILATVRSRAEGGEGPDQPSERAELIARVAGFPFALVDLELERDAMPAVARAESTSRWVGSHHLPADTGIDVLGAAVERVRDQFAFSKFVLPASIERYLQEIRPRLPGWVSPRTTVFTTGASGPLARVAARELGQPVVFASLPLPEPDAPPPVEPSQVPSDQLHRSWSVTDGRRFAVLGHPVAHSLSPAIHAGWLASERRPACFVALDAVRAEELQLLADPTLGGRWDGWSVTAPWKSTTPGLARRTSEAVRATGVANTLTFRDGEATADLTDADAIRRRALELVGEGAWDGSEALVLGTGGSARAAVFALAPERRKVLLLGRRPDAVGALAREIGGRPADVEDRHPVGLVVHATTFGRSGAGPLDLVLNGWVGPATTVLDFVYDADDPALRGTAEALGARYEDGRRLLVYQAAEAHRIWWGQPPDADAVASALRRVGCAE